MFSEDNESQLFKVIKGLLYVFMIGCLFYAGGYGWALLFTRDEDKRNKVGYWNLILLLLWTLMIVIAFIHKMSQRGTPSNAFIDTVLYMAVVHAAISLVGSLFYICWFLFNLIFSKSSDDYPSEKRFQINDHVCANFVDYYREMNIAKITNRLGDRLYHCVWYQNGQEKLAKYTGSQLSLWDGQEPLHEPSYNDAHWESYRNLGREGFIQKIYERFGTTFTDEELNMINFPDKTYIQEEYEKYGIKTNDK